MSNHLFDAIRMAVQSPDTTFIETLDGRRWTYEDALHLSGKIANAMNALGVLPGDRVAVQVEKSPWAIMLYLACLRCGAVYLPLNTAYTPAELQYFIGDAEPRLIVISPTSLQVITEIAEPHNTLVETLDAQGCGSLMQLAERESTDYMDASRAADDIAAILYTSGTTGRSKGAMLTHGNLLSNAVALRECWQVDASDKLIHALPIFHTHGLFVATNVTLLSAAGMFLLPRFDPEQILSLMQQSTIMMGVPTFYVRLLQDGGLTPRATANMRLFISGSAPLLPETHAAFKDRTGHAILERYGMTETNMNTSNPYEGDRVAGTVGFPLRGISIRVTDPTTGSELPTSETGMIEIKGPNVFAGYWRMPEKTKTEFTMDGYFISGDLGRFDHAGYLHIIGRSKDLVISGGFNIYPKEVESEIDRLDGVAESAVIGVAHPDFGEGVTAVVVLHPGASLDETAVLDVLSNRLAGYKRPKRILFVQDLPRNTMGKVQKKLLREQYASLYARAP